MPGPAVAGFFPGAEVGLVSRLWAALPFIPGQMPVIREWLGQEKGFREEADGNHAVAAWLNGG